MSCASTNATARPSEPSLSSHADTTLPTAETVKLAVLRAKLRAVIDAKVQEQSKGRLKKMGWTKRGYRRIVIKGGMVLRGWPRGSDGIPFQNLSYVKGGKAAMLRLAKAWESGELRFEDATEEEVDLALRCPAAVLPGDAPVLPAPQCWGPFVRNDMGLTRDPTKKKQKMGPKTPKIVPYDSVDTDEEIESGDESNIGGQRESKHKTGNENEYEREESDSGSIEAAVWSADAGHDNMSDIEEFED